MSILIIIGLIVLLIAGWAVIGLFCYNAGSNDGYIEGRDKVISYWSDTMDVICAEKPEIREEYAWIFRGIYYRRTSARTANTPLNGRKAEFEQKERGDNGTESNFGKR